MPSNAHDLVVVVQSFDNLQLILVFRIRNHNALVEASTCNKVSISWIGYAPNLGLMKLLMVEALPHLEVPRADRAIVVANWAETLHESVLLRGVCHLILALSVEVSTLVRIEADLVHLGEVGAVHLVNVLVAPNIPNLDYFVDAYWDSKGPVIRRLNGVNVTLVALEICYVLTCLRVPDLDIVFHESSREKHCWVLWIEANSPNNGLVSN